MQHKQCPVCFSELEVINCAPCDDCGHIPDEIEHFKSGIHTYTIYEIAHDLRLQLCDFCAVDFGSYLPEYLGLNQTPSMFEFHFVKEVSSPAIAKDKYCPSCSKRLTFLLFLRDLRELGNRNAQ